MPAKSIKFSRSRTPMYRARATLMPMQTKAVSSIANTAIHRQIENKSALYVEDTTTVIFPTGSTMLELTSIAQGNSVGERNGVQIRGRGLIARIFLVLDTGITLANPIRIMMFYWNDSVAPTVAELLHSTKTTSVRKWVANRKLGQVLMDKLVLLDQYRPSKVLTIKKKINNIRTRFSGSAVNTGVYGRLYLFMLADNANDVYYRLQNRYLYEDA